MVVLVVGGGHVPAHGQAEVVLGVGGEVGAAAHLALAVADLDQIQHVVTLGGVARVVVEVAEGLAGVVELGDNGNRVAVRVEGDVLGGVDAGDLRAVAGDLGLAAVDGQALFGVDHQVVVQVHAGVTGLVVEVLVVAGDHAVGVEAVGVAGAAGPGHFVAVDAEKVVKLLVVVLGGGAGLLPLGGGAGRVFQQGAQIIVAGGGGGGGGVEVVGVVGDDDEVHIVHAVGVFIRVLQGTRAVGILCGVGVDLAEVQGLAALTDEEVPGLVDGLPVVARDGDGDGVLAVAHVLGGGVAQLVAGDGRVDGFAVELHHEAGVLADVGKGNGDLRLLFLAGGGVGRGHGAQDQRLVADLVGPLGLVALAQRVGDEHADGQLGRLFQIEIVDRELALAAVHGGRHGHDVADDRVFVGDLVLGRDRGRLADVVDREADHAVRADGGIGGVKLNAGVDHVADVVPILHGIELHRKQLRGLGLEGPAAEHVVEELNAAIFCAVLGGLVLHFVAAGALHQRPLGVLLLVGFGGQVDQQQALVVVGLAVLVHGVFGHGQILAVVLERIDRVGSGAGDVNREDQAAVGHVLIGDRVVFHGRGSGLQGGSRHVRAGGLTHHGLGVVVVDHVLAAVRRQAAGGDDLTDAAILVGGGGEELELIEARAGGLVAPGLERAVVDLQVDRVAVVLEADVLDVVVPGFSGLVGHEAPLGVVVVAKLVHKDQFFGVVQRKILAADLEDVILAGLDELDDRGAVGETLDALAVGRDLNGFCGSAAADVSTHHVVVHVEQNAVALVGGQALDRSGTLAHLGGKAEDGQRGEHHDKRQQQSKRSGAMLLHSISS